MVELKPRPTVRSPQASPASEGQQTRRLLLALVLLLVAFAGVVMKDRQFWFGSDPSALDSETAEPSARVRQSAPSAVKRPRSVPAPLGKKQTSVATNSVEPKPADAPVVATHRTVLPPLEVEVVAGDIHRTIHPGTNAAKVEITHSAAAATQLNANIASATNASEREKMPVDGREGQASYPLLAQHMNVQGSVVLQAVIGADGVVQNLHVVSGPAILASAAQQAVREWRFKPVLQNGQAVETKAKITVNFNIKIADGAANTTLAESRAADTLIITR
jgi:TonB family protein